eukprot:1136949-Pelagomonas_calceolata.AAC.10
MYGIEDLRKYGCLATVAAAATAANAEVQERERARSACGLNHPHMKQDSITLKPQDKPEQPRHSNREENTHNAQRKHSACLFDSTKGTSGLGHTHLLIKKADRSKDLKRFNFVIA